MDKIKKGAKVAVGMSGGVDSTVSAFLLKQRGYDVFGLTMQIWDGKVLSGKNKSGCYGPGEFEDVKAAEEACRRIGIKHYNVGLQKEYKESVIEYFRSEYEKGRTPNPCIVCNAKIKFKLLLDKAFASGLSFDYFATGHYARVAYDKKYKRFVLKRGVDKKKDQSYFLYRLQQSQLQRIIFPLGGMTKEEARSIARKNGFTDYAEKGESQNFVECDNYFSLLPPGKPGKIIDYQGAVIGDHEGISHYTVGQRRNLKIGGLKEPYYVLKIDARRNAIIVGPKNFAYSREMRLRNINWMIPSAASLKNIKAKIRYGAPLASCRISVKGRAVSAIFNKPQFAITPGQSAVFYSGDKVVGGGMIF